MKLKNVMVIIAALTIGGTIFVIQTGGLVRTLHAVESFLGLDGGDSYSNVRTVDAQAATDYRWSGRVADGESVEIKGINGSVTFALAQGDEVVVTAEARARRSDPSTVRIERVEHAQGLTFCAVYPTPEGREQNRCGPGGTGQMNTERNDVQVDFVVQVPEGVSVVGRTVNGSVEALGLRSDVVAESVNGDIEISTTGFAVAETVNGSIEASMGSSDFFGDVQFSTVNGSIDLDLPDDIDADVDASWLNGGFESDIPLLLQGGMSKRSAHGVFGDGGPRLELETVNGSIRIR